MKQQSENKSRSLQEKATQQSRDWDETGKEKKKARNKMKDPEEDKEQPQASNHPETIQVQFQGPGEILYVGVKQLQNNGPFVELTRQEYDQLKHDHTLVKKQPLSKKEAAQKVRVQYRGPGHILHVGKKQLHRNGPPVTLSRQEYEELQQQQNIEVIEVT